MPYALINCVECFTPRLLYESILLQLEHCDNSGDNFIYPRCENMNAFIRLLKYQCQATGKQDLGQWNSLHCSWQSWKAARHGCTCSASISAASGTDTVQHLCCHDQRDSVGKVQVWDRVLWAHNSTFPWLFQAWTATDYVKGLPHWSAKGVLCCILSIATQCVLLCL